MVLAMVLVKIALCFKVGLLLYSWGDAVNMRMASTSPSTFIFPERLLFKLTRGIWSKGVITMRLKADFKVFFEKHQLIPVRQLVIVLWFNCCEQNCRLLSLRINFKAIFQFFRVWTRLFIRTSKYCHNFTLAASWSVRLWVLYGACVLTWLLTDYFY